MVANKVVLVHARALTIPGVRISRVVPFFTETNRTLLKSLSRTGTAISAPSGDQATADGRRLKVDNSCSLLDPGDSRIKRDIPPGTQRMKASVLPSGAKLTGV